MVSHETNISRFKKQQQQICIIIQKFIQVERKLSHLGRNLHTYTYIHIQNRFLMKREGQLSLVFYNLKDWYDFHNFPQTDVWSLSI